ncbi:protein kinase [Rhodococcus sp. ACS1]|uniref:protein kinase domain-containing protein n=1 Tax=Rhodococcus sp. ACS1 TaxID=2028570 RepID=UPI000BB1611B|nr:protein kinase [Rhodococcus sp. ACS1]PBC39575.1 protein kinase [Rhodococcus sp. ACS1]
MIDVNSATQRGVPHSVAAELKAVGLEDAKEIGRGGFGVVFRCMQPSLDRTVAVKVLVSALDPENVGRFVREQRAMGRLSGHPNIVNVFEVGVTRSGLPYIVMQYHPKDSLGTWIRDNGPLEWGQALRVGVKMAGALETAHRVDVLHRDVKPSNILLTEYGDPQLTDFGIAHMVGAFETSTGAVTGSPAFAAPEVLAGDSANPTSDVYSLGATLFCAITGHVPFERRRGEQIVAQFLRITTQPIPDLREHDVPNDVSAAIEHAMARNPRDRPATAAEFGDELRASERRHDRRVDDMAVPRLAESKYPEGDPVESKPGGISTELAQNLPLARSTSERTPTLGRHRSMPPKVRGKTGNLPLEVTSFVGRRRELAETKKMLSGARLVTLTGIGGVGKTRLALRVATDSRRAFKDGVWLIELDELHDAMLVISTVSATLGLRHQSADPPVALLTDYLFGKQLLLVLDNCEHLVDAVATLAKTLLRTCPGVRILATSREPLCINGEATIRVPPMSVPGMGPSSLQGLPQYESVNLFVERAVTVLPEFELTEDNQAAVAQICQRLEGLPLLVELAAVRLRSMTAQQILDRLTDRYRLLNAGSRGAPSRQQTLRLCIDWSFELCTTQEQQLWARLTVFAGSFQLDAAEAVCAGGILPADLLDLVASLVDKSILIREEAGAVVRYRILETLRDYGREKLQMSGEYSALQRRHRDWYLQFVLQAESDWVSPRQLEWITRLEREHPNFRSALRFCLSEQDDAEDGLRLAAGLFPFWLSRGHLAEGRLWLDRALASKMVTPTEGRAKSLYLASVLAGMQGDIPAGETLLAKGNGIADGFDNDSMSALAGYATGCTALYSGKPSLAVVCFEKAIAEARGDGYIFCQIGSLLGLGLAFMLLDDSARAIHWYETMLAVTERHGELLYSGRASTVGGWALWRGGDPGRATAVLEQGLRQASRVDDPVGCARCLQTLAWIEADQCREDRAAVLLGAAESMWRDIGDRTASSASLLDKLLYQKECARRIRRTLGDREFEERIRHGNAMSFEEASSYALRVKDPSPQAESAKAAMRLTRRERQVADLVAEGLTNKAIAAKLVISQRTAQGHVEHILAKLGFTSRTQVAAWVIKADQKPNTQP